MGARGKISLVSGGGGPGEGGGLGGGTGFQEDDYHQNVAIDNLTTRSKLNRVKDSIHWN